MNGAVLDIALSSSPGVAKRALLREPNARNELLPQGAGPVAVTEMIAALLTKGPSSLLGPSDVWKLSLSDRDRIVASLHTSCFGDRVESIVTCSTCGQPFEMTFSLAEEVVQPLDRPAAASQPIDSDEGGMYALQDGRRFRLPNAEDERALQGLPVEEATRELIRRCVASGETTSDNDEALDTAMSAVAPIMDVDVPVECGICHTELKVRFDMVSFFISSLARERPILLREIHRLAVTYHWSREEIMDMPRSLRRAHVELIEIDRGSLRVPI